MFTGDLRYAIRSFAKNPGFTAIAVASLALGIGANTAIFSLLDRVMLRSLPVRDPQQLVLFTAEGPRRGFVNTAYDDKLTFSYPMYLDFRDRAPDFAGVIAWYPLGAAVSVEGSTERAQANLVSGNFFQTLGAGTAIGRPILPDDARTMNANAVTVLSYAYWQQRFGGDPSILNRQITINGQPLTVVGVAAKGFFGVAMGEAPAAFIPVTMKNEVLQQKFPMESRRAMWLNVMGRLKPGVTRASAEAAMNAFWRPVLEEELKAMPAASEAFRARFRRRHLTLEDAWNGFSNLRASFEKPLTLLMGLVGLVLLIACANVANLMIARASGRQKEIAIRLAIGGTRADIVRQMLTESVLLACAAGAAGVYLAYWCGKGLLALLPFADYTTDISAAPDPRILAFTATVSIVCGVAFGLVPAWQSARQDLAGTMKEQGGGVISGGHALLRKGLVVGQIALSLLLLTGAGLFLNSLGNLRRIELGFRPDHLLSFAINPSLNGYDSRRAVALFDRLRQRLGALPGVRAVASTQTRLLNNENWMMSVEVPGYRKPENDDTPNLDTISPGYFAAIGTPMAAGREFRSSDDSNAPQVAIVNQTFARIYFAGANPIGRQFTIGDSKQPVQIVGVVKDGKYSDVREKKQRFVFLPYAQAYNAGIGPMTFYLRTAQDPDAIGSAVRAAMHEVDPNVPAFSMITMERQIDEDVFADRILTFLSASFGLLATVLAAVGLYGVMSYAVARRTREIGIRMALGARRGNVLVAVMGEVALLAGIGIAMAVPLSFPLTNLARAMLFGVAPHDAWTLLGASSLLMLTALAAGYIPAARAASVDPLIALRSE